MGIRWQITLHFAQFVHQNIETPGRRLSSSLKDVAWQEEAQLIFLIFHIFVWLGRCISRCGSQKKYRQMYGKLEKLCNLLPGILTSVIHKYR